MFTIPLLFPSYVFLCVLNRSYRTTDTVFAVDRRFCDSERLLLFLFRKDTLTLLDAVGDWLDCNFNPSALHSKKTEKKRPSAEGGRHTPNDVYRQLCSVSSPCIIMKEYLTDTVLQTFVCVFCFRRPGGGHRCSLVVL